MSTLSVWIAVAAIVAWFFLRVTSTARIFMPIHDCGHISFYTSKRDNDELGKWLQLLTYTDFSVWRAGHNRHHNVQGNASVLDEAATIQITTEEYESYSLPMRIVYRVVRDPIVFLLTFPAFYWLLMIPATARSWQSRFSIPLHAAALYAVGWARYALFTAAGAQGVLLGITVSPPTVMAATLLAVGAVYVFAMCGLFAFHLQHGVNTGYRALEAEYDAGDEAMLGSTYIPMAFPIDWFMWGINFHHIHHMSTRVPCYQLRDCHEKGEEMGLWCEVVSVESKLILSSTFNTLWSNRAGGYVSFWPYNLITGPMEGNWNYAGVFKSVENKDMPSKVRWCA